MQQEAARFLYGAYDVNNSGAGNGDNITASYDSPATVDSPDGTYPIIPTLLDPTGKLGNYTVTITNGTLTVTL